MAKLRETDLAILYVLREKGWSTRAGARELGVDESTLRYRIARWQRGAEDGRAKQAEACAPSDEVIAPWIAEQQGGEGRPEAVRTLSEQLLARHG